MRQKSSNLRVLCQGLRFRVQGLGFRVQCLGLILFHNSLGPYYDQHEHDLRGTGMMQKKMGTRE